MPSLKEQLMKTHEIFEKITVILYYGNGKTTEHEIIEDNPELWAEKAKRIYGAQHFYIPQIHNN